MLGRISRGGVFAAIMVFALGAAVAAPPPVATVPLVRSLGMDCRPRDYGAKTHVLSDGYILGSSYYTAYCAIDGVAAPVSQIGSARLHISLVRSRGEAHAELCFRQVSGSRASCGPRVYATAGRGTETLVLKPPTTRSNDATDAAFIRFYMPSDSSYSRFYGYEVLRHVPVPPLSAEPLR